MRFSAILFIADKPSTTPPSGARGHKILISKNLIEKSITSIIGKSLFAEKNLAHHDRDSSIGIIDAAGVTGDLVWIKGYLFRENPLVLSLSASEEILGVSYDSCNAHVINMRRLIWELEKIEFFGATVVLQRNAAYKEDCLFWLE